MKFNITIGEVESILGFAHAVKKEGKDVLCMEVDCGETGCQIKIGNGWDEAFEDITDYEAW